MKYGLCAFLLLNFASLGAWAQTPAPVAVSPMVVTPQERAKSEERATRDKAYGVMPRGMPTTQAVPPALPEGPPPTGRRPLAPADEAAPGPNALPPAPYGQTKETPPFPIKKVQ